MAKKKIQPRLRFKDDKGNDFPDWEEKILKEIFDIKAGGDLEKEQVSKIKTEIFKYPVYSNSEKEKGLFGYTNIYKVDKPSITVTGEVH